MSLWLRVLIIRKDTESFEISLDKLHLAEFTNILPGIIGNLLIDFIKPKGVSLYLTHSIGASVMNFICFPCLTIISIKSSSNDNLSFSEIL